MSAEDVVNEGQDNGSWRRSEKVEMDAEGQEKEVGEEVGKQEPLGVTSHVASRTILLKSKNSGPRQNN